MDMTFCELRQKNVINTLNGKCLGKPVDLIFGLKSACILGIAVPGDRRLFRTSDDIFIAWDKITKIGDDVILVKLEECFPAE